MKELLLLALSFTFITQTYGQFSFGLKGGGNLSSVEEVNKSDLPDFFEEIIQETEYLQGVQVGLQATYLSNRFEVAAELLYAQKGYLEKMPQPSGDIAKAKVRYVYLGIPASFRYYIIDNMYAGLGGELARLQSAKSTLDGNTIDLLEHEFLPAPDRFDFGLLAEIGYRFHERLGVQLRYVHGLSNTMGEIQFTDVNGEPLQSVNYKVQNRSFQLSLTMDLLKSK